MKILMITYIPPETEGRVDRSVRELAKQNEIIIVTCNSRFNYYNNAQIKSVNLCKGGNIKRYLEFFAKTVWSILANKEQYDLIYAHNFFSGLPAIVLLKLHISRKLIYDAYELLIPNGGMKFSLRDYFFYFIEKRTIKKADCLICASEIRGYIMLGHYNLKSLPIIVQNVLEIEPTKKINRFPADRTAITILYAGYISSDRNIDKLIIAVKKLGDKFKLVIAGDGPETCNLKKMVKDQNMKNVEFKGRYTRDQLTDIVDNCHIGYISYPCEGFNNIFCAPNKLSEYANNGLPIIATPNPGLAFYINKYCIGIVTDNLAEGIKKIVENYDYYFSNLDNYIKENNWEKEAPKLSKAVKEI